MKADFCFIESAKRCRCAACRGNLLVKHFSMPGPSLISFPFAREQGPRNCYIEVRNVLSGLEIQRNWETDWGSYDRDYFGRLILNIRLGTVGRTGGPMKIQWFWIGRPLIDINRLIVYGKGEKVVVVPARYFTEYYAAAPILKNHTLNLVALRRAICVWRAARRLDCVRE